MTPPPARDLVCEVCGRHIGGSSQRAYELHLIRHGPTQVARYVGRPNLGSTAMSEVENVGLRLPAAAAPPAAAEKIPERYTGFRGMRARHPDIASP